MGEGRPRASSRKGFIRLEVDGSVRSPGEVGSNFQIVFGGRGRELELGLPSLFGGIFCGGTCGPRPRPQWPFPFFFFFFFNSVFGRPAVGQARAAPGTGSWRRSRAERGRERT